MAHSRQRKNYAAANGRYDVQSNALYETSGTEADFKFKDSKKISANFVNPVAVAHKLNIIRGDHRKDGVYFKPQDNATIAHASAFLFRLFSAAEVLKPIRTK